MASFLSEALDTDMSIEDLVGQVAPARERDFSLRSRPAACRLGACVRSLTLLLHKPFLLTCYVARPPPRSVQLAECRRLLHLYEIDNKALKSRCRRGRAPPALCCAV